MFGLKLNNRIVGITQPLFVIVSNVLIPKVDTSSVVKGTTLFSI